ncbi:DUF4124 domain-containing protein [Allochromatium vinosum]|uniref:DUF4124 domain-containing protein n=1 Tax=Allochromatium vinosum (strain ATCC 17899 / DSM 180 / NBRC 103801 / NCIMB 10441 / D) TaxID=572477 RepID=D3RW57_ALLVD|nr:DUF4124 domain-containing protein [Allochromatium vinosum]ADC64069.1 conserved hypothetical protein [Allochromatium vinosum DSM 180]
MRKITALIAVMLATSGAQAQVYKCADPITGETVYSQTQCATEAKTVNIQDIQATPTVAIAENDALARRCANSIQFKDPDSVRIEKVGAMSATVIDYAGSRIVANVLHVWINARNSYGGYTGSKMYYCYLSQHDKKVLFVESLGG